MLALLIKCYIFICQQNTVDLIGNIMLLKSIENLPYKIRDNIKWYLEKPWNWYFMSRRNEVTQEVINLLPDQPWDYYFLIKDRKINFPGIKEVNGEIIRIASIPPLFDKRKVFINGGALFKESWEEIEMLFK